MNSLVPRLILLPVDARGPADTDRLHKRGIHSMERPHLQLRDHSPSARHRHPRADLQPRRHLHRVCRPVRHRQVLPAEHEQPDRMACTSGGRARAQFLAGRRTVRHCERRLDRARVVLRREPRRARAHRPRVGRQVRRVAPDYGAARVREQRQPHQVLGPAHWHRAHNTVRLLFLSLLKLTVA